MLCVVLLFFLMGHHPQLDVLHTRYPPLALGQWRAAQTIYYAIYINLAKAVIESLPIFGLNLVPMEYAGLSFFEMPRFGL